MVCIVLIAIACSATELRAQGKLFNVENLIKPPANNPPNAQVQAPQVAGEIQKRIADATQRLHDSVNYELTFVNLTCKLTQEQQEILRSAFDQHAKVMAERFTQCDFQPNGAVIYRGLRFQKGVRATFRPFHLLDQELVATLQSQLTPEQFAAYEKERKLRDEAAAEWLTMILLERLHERLKLSPKQRQEITEPMKAWALGSLDLVEPISLNAQLIPNIGDDCFGDVLTDGQLSLWHSLSKRDLEHFGLGTPVNGASQGVEPE